MHVLVKYQPQGTHVCGWYIATGAKELSGHLEARNEAELTIGNTIKPTYGTIGNTIKPTYGTIGKENPNLGRRMVARRPQYLQHQCRKHDRAKEP